jgi:hypothetical protein
MNEQTKRRSVSSSSKALNIEAGAEEMIARVMTLAQLLIIQSVVEDSPGANSAPNRYKKHRTENL